MNKVITMLSVTLCASSLLATSSLAIAQDDGKPDKVTELLFQPVLTLRMLDGEVVLYRGLKRLKKQPRVRLNSTCNHLELSRVVPSHLGQQPPA